MKLNKRQLRKMILREMRLLTEGVQTVTIHPRTAGYKGSYKVPFEYTTERKSGAGAYFMRGNKSFSVDGKEAKEAPSGWVVKGLKHDDKVHKVKGSGTVSVKSIE